MPLITPKLPQNTILPPLPIFLNYDYLFRTPTKNMVNRMIYAKNLKFCIAAVFVVCQRDNHILNYGST